MKMLRLRGKVEEIEEKILIVSDRKGNETFRLPQSSMPDLEPGDAVDCYVVPPSSPTGLCRVMSRKDKKAEKPKRSKEATTLMRAMLKMRATLIAEQNVLERNENPDPNELDRLFEKLEFLDRGFKLFAE
ncbi:MAG TPA: hypothetical protein PKO06_12335 [Candidatus Ozemobacteraceae bacterium]|nr:hypothetical protein [Candidatus Ozemobacteraceae bacterium]